MRNNKSDFVFVTGNLKKVFWLEKFLGRKVEHHALELEETQSLDLVKIVEHKAREAYKHLQKSVLIEDTSLAFAALGGLPGPFVKFFLESERVGNAGMCKILDNFDDRSAVASVTYGFYDGKTFQSFGAEVNGMVSNVPRGGKGMGWDPIFIPDGQSKTYAEMSEVEHDKYSVRNKAVHKLKNEFIK
ncbi:XTP/dITP diphosphatase [soil metagenome]